MGRSTRADPYRSAVDYMLLELADHDGDIDRSVALLSGGGRPYYGEVVSRLRAAGRHAHLMVKARSLYDKAGHRSEADAEIIRLRETYRRRPALMTAMNRAGLHGRPPASERRDPGTSGRSAFGTLRQGESWSEVSLS